jgi:hypothetical protein
LVSVPAWCSGSLARWAHSNHEHVQPPACYFVTSLAGPTRLSFVRLPQIIALKKQSSLVREASVKIARVFAPSQPAITRIFLTLLHQSGRNFVGGFCIFTPWFASTIYRSFFPDAESGKCSGADKKTSAARLIYPDHAHIAAIRSEKMQRVREERYDP